MQDNPARSSCVLNGNSGPDHANAEDSHASVIHPAREFSPLREYQRRAIERARGEFVNAARAVLLVAPTGSGKSVIFAEIARQHLARGGRVVVVVHRRELARQAAGHLAARGIANIRTIVGGRSLGDVNAPVTVAAIQSLTAKAWRDRLPPATLVIWDECFPAGTAIDGKPIESLRAGDEIESFNHDTNRIEKRRIVRTFKSVPHAMVRVVTNDGRAIVCTAGHPFFTGTEYVPALQINEGDALYGSELSRVREACGCVDQRQERCVQAIGARVLLAGMPLDLSEEAKLGDNGRYESPLCVGKDEVAQPDAVRGQSREDENNTTIHRTRADLSWRQREARSRCAESTCGGAWMGDGVCGWNRARREGCRTCDPLQDRHRGPGTKDCDRGGRREPLLDGSSRAGREKSDLSRVARVARVEVLERGSDGTFGGVLADGHVYNVEVEANHNYFVAGVLVHNCHHIKAPSFMTVRDAYSSALHIGLTATPQRADRSPLGDVFDSMVVIATVRELTDAGYLVQCEVWGPNGARNKLSADAVDAYLEHGENKRAIVFCANVVHAKECAERLRDAGVASEYVDGTMATRDRDASLARFASGQTQVITNCNLISEGFDVPACKCIVIARGCDSVAMYLQAVGRALRPEPSGETALVIDLRGATHKHGMPDADRQFSLSGEAISTGPGVEPVKQCKRCGAVYKPVPHCPRCGAASPMPVAPEVRAEQIQRITEAHTEDQRREYWQRLQAEAQARGYKHGWAYHRYRARYGVPPRAA
jgi:DNA repair protein RadD